MKVLMLGWELPPNNSGGLGVACLQLSKALANAGADIEFVLPYQHNEEYPFMKVTPAVNKSFDPKTVFGVYDSYKLYDKNGEFVSLEAHAEQINYAQKVGRMVESLEFDIIHAHDWLTFRAALLARERTGKPLVLHIHSIERDRAGGNPGHPLVREIEAISMLLADHVLAVSERTKQAIIDDYNIPADKIEVIYNSIDPEMLTPLDTENAYKYLEALKLDGWKVVSNIGRLTIQKGLPHLISAAAMVIAKNPKTMFLLVGDGEQRDQLIELAAEKRIANNIIFTGFQRGKNWRDAYAISDLFVMPSVSEPFGLTPFEAAAYGTPSMISKQSGAAEVFKSCLKVDFWDEFEMANKILAVLNNPALGSVLKENAAKEYQELSWSKSADQIMSRYNKFRQKQKVYA